MKPRGLKETFHRWWFEDEAPHGLAVCRILFYAGLLAFYLPREWAGWGHLPDVFYIKTTPLAKLGVGVASPALLTAMKWVWHASALLCCLGIFFRPASIICFCCGYYLLDLPQNFYKVNHNDQILVLTMGILAFSRCADAYSLRRLIAARRSPTMPPLPPSGEYRWPIRMVWLSLAWVFFAAGFAKIRFGGLDWFKPESMGNTLIDHAYGFLSFPPWFDWGPSLAGLPWLCTAMAVFGAAAEFFFPLALFFPRLRIPLVVSALLMQVGIRALLGPHFEQFLLAYLFWLPWGRWFGNSEGSRKLEVP